jgi:hypothetical protein
LNEAFIDDELLLSVAVEGSMSPLYKATGIKKLAKYVDMLNLKAYVSLFLINKK